MLRNAKTSFYNRLNGANKKLFWKTMKQLHKKESSVPTLSYYGTTATDDKSKADRAFCFAVEMILLLHCLEEVLG